MLKRRIIAVLVLLALGYATARDHSMWATAWGAAEQGLRWAGRHLSKV